MYLVLNTGHLAGGIIVEGWKHISENVLGKNIFIVPYAASWPTSQSSTFGNEMSSDSFSVYGPMCTTLKYP